MLYREAGDFKTSYHADNQTFPIRFDRIGFWITMVIAFAVIPFVINDYWANAILVPFLIYAIAAIGLNILTGYCGQVSLGTGGFMAVGAYACYKLMTGLDIYFASEGFVSAGGEMISKGGESFEVTGQFLFFTIAQNAEWTVYVLTQINPVIAVILAGFVTAAVGVLFGLPSLRIKGFYLAVATLAAQFFLVWLFNKISWFYNYSASGQINAPERFVSEIAVTGPNTAPWAQYMVCLIFVVVCALIARNLTRGTVGRSWMAIRDMDIAAEIIGVNPLKAKLTAFAVSSFFIGISGALFFSVYLGAVEVGEAFGIQKSFLVLFMIIIGGLGSIFGCFAGAAFLVLLPVALKVIGVDVLGWPTDIVSHLNLVIVGALIMFFLIKEPHGLAQIWRLAKEKLRLWPFPY
ncbi:branched-chain amino acid ABC transporter permease [Yoonia sp. R2-816]|uniref:branched-chain amino acid ABC transporter permease n=1 Tax=Yoonia sp. R2-816 TaxID=3342638 RepID=UPI00372822B3